MNVKNVKKTCHQF